MTTPPPVEVDLELDSPPVLPVSNLSGQSGVVIGGAVVLYGWCLRETTGAAVAQVDLYDGGDATGQLVATVAIPAGGSVITSLAPAGVLCRRGLYAKQTAGVAAVVAWVSRP